MAIYETGGSLYLIGTSGNLMQVSEADGSWKQVLPPQSLTNSIAAAVLSGTGCGQSYAQPLHS